MFGAKRHFIRPYWIHKTAVAIDAQHQAGYLYQPEFSPTGNPFASSVIVRVEVLVPHSGQRYRRFPSFHQHRNPEACYRTSPLPLRQSSSKLAAFSLALNSQLAHRNPSFGVTTLLNPPRFPILRKFLLSAWRIRINPALDLGDALPMPKNQNHDRNPSTNNHCHDRNQKRPKPVIDSMD